MSVDLVDNLLDEKGFNETCNSCDFYHEWQEGHPYGDTVAYETLAECNCPEDDQCPRIQDGERSTKDAND